MLVASEFVRLASDCLAMIQEAADASNKTICRLMPAAPQRSEGGLLILIVLLYSVRN